MRESPQPRCASSSICITVASTSGFQLQDTRPALDLVKIVKDLSTSRDVPAAIAAVEPQFYHYKLLERSLRRYRQLTVRQAALPPLPRMEHYPLRAGIATWVLLRSENPATDD